MQVVSFEDDLHEMSLPIFWENKKKNILKCPLLKLLLIVPNVKPGYGKFPKVSNTLLHTLLA